MFAAARRFLLAGTAHLVRLHFGAAWVLALLLTCCPSGSLAQSKRDYEKSRQTMVEEFIVAAGVKDARVVKAMLATPRHEFVAANLRDRAYLDMALPIGDQQTISSPFIVAYMTQSLDPQPTDKVLEIGTGSGYQAAVLSPLVKDVYTIEIVEPLGLKAEKLLKKLDYHNVHVMVGDGYKGWPERAPFDKIIVTCSPEKVPQPLVDQLADGGLMVVPVGERYQQTLYLYRKRGEKLESEALLPTLFVPMTGKAEDNRIVKPDPANPKVANGGFEEEAFKGGAQPGWYYERQVSRQTSESAPQGKHYVTISNAEPGLPAHLLQGFAIDGRQVRELELSAMVRTEKIEWGRGLEERPQLAITLYDESRKELGNFLLGPFHGTTDWSKISKVVDVPKTAREGILRIGLFGARGTISFDDVQMKKVDKAKK
jgi:protein-L-isoaspartate(D-aspartate) O-methyltransferase